MIYEMAHLRIDPVQAEEFEAAVASCESLFRAAAGCRSMLLERQMEDPAAYVLRVGWDTVEDHMIGFRESPPFAEWRSRVSGFFAADPIVVHQVRVITGF